MYLTSKELYIISIQSMNVYIIYFTCLFTFTARLGNMNSGVQQCPIVDEFC